MDPILKIYAPAGESEKPAGLPAVSILPPAVPLLLCEPDGTIRLRSDAAKKLLPPPGKYSKKEDSIFYFLHPSGKNGFLSLSGEIFVQKRRHFGFFSYRSRASGAHFGNGFSPPSELLSMENSAKSIFLACAPRPIYKGHHDPSVILISLPFADSTQRLSFACCKRQQDRDETEAMIRAVTLFGADYLRKPKNVALSPGELPLHPWLCARLLSLRFEPLSKLDGFRSAERCFLLCKQLLFHSSLFPEALPIEWKEMLRDPGALFLPRSSSFIALLLGILRFSSELSADRRRIMAPQGKMQIYMQQNTLIAFFQLSLYQKSGRTKETDFPFASSYFNDTPANAARALLCDPSEKFSTLSPLPLAKHLQLSLLSSVCRRLGWELTGGEDREVNGHALLSWKLAVPVQRSREMAFFEKRVEYSQDLLNLLAFLCPG